MNIDNRYIGMFRGVVTRKQLDSIGTYIDGIATEMKSFSVKGFSQINGTSRDRMEFLISRAKWDERQLNRKRVELDMENAISSEFDFVIDESGILKYTLRPYFIERGWIGNVGKIDRCFSNVFGNFVSDTDNIPFDFETYLQASKLFEGKRSPEFRSKLDQMLSLCLRANYMAKELGKSIRYFSFDKWFSASWILDQLNNNKAKYFTEVRSNRLVKVGDTWIHAGDLVTVSSITPEVINYKGQTYKIFSYIGKLKRLNHTVKLFAVTGRFRHNKKETRIFITNDHSITTAQVFPLINRRWQIEHFFKQTKSWLALDQAKFQKLLCYKRHFYLVFLTWGIARQHIKSRLHGITTIFQFVRARFKLKKDLQL